MVDAIIDLPFALPTIVASLVLLSLYGPGSPVGIRIQHTAWGVALALAFVTLPFVVRAVQPVLLELDREVEEAAASLGANSATIFLQSHPARAGPVAAVAAPGWRSPGPSASSASIVLIGGAIPGETEVSSQWIRTLIENDDRVGAAAISIVLLLISFVVLFVLRYFGARAAKREELGRDDAVPVHPADPAGHRARCTSSRLLVVPLGAILWRDAGARVGGVRRLDLHARRAVRPAALAAGGGHRGAAERHLRCADGHRAGPAQVPR